MYNSLKHSLRMAAGMRLITLVAWVFASFGLLNQGVQAQNLPAAPIYKATAVKPNTYAGIGRAATPQELSAWDIDVRPDFKGLPKGSGSVAKGMQVWEAKCASCHGVFGEAVEVFNPIVGGTTAEDVKNGRVARLTDSSYPGRTTLMKLPSLSTLWDYINRAMPWTQPKTLTTEEVYAVTAYILNLGNLVPDNFVLSDQNMAQVQAQLPNRNGMSTQHALWPSKALAGAGGAGGADTSKASAKRQLKPDVSSTLCMRNCGDAPQISSTLPDYARDAHGNLAEQNRSVGAQRGADTTKPENKTAKPREFAAVGSVAVAPAASPAAPDKPTDKPSDKPADKAPAKAEAPKIDTVSGKDALAAAQKHTCTACHALDAKLVGPSFKQIAQKQGGRADAQSYLEGKIKAGGAGVYGAIPMPAQNLPPADAQLIARWLMQGAKK